METIGKYEVKIFIGSRNEETHNSFTESQLIKTIQRWQTSSGKGNFLPVRIHGITYVSGVDYYENGFEITACRLPSRNESEKDVWNWTLKLAEHLLRTFRQHRVGVSDEDHMVYLRSSDN